MFDLVDLNILIEILKLLPIKSVIDLKFTCKTYNKIISKKIIDKLIICRINNRLEEIFGDDIFIFKKLLKKTESYISGSFIVQCIIDERWYSDIDIYIRNKYQDEISNYILTGQKKRYGHHNSSQYTNIIGMGQCILFCTDDINYKTKNKLQTIIIETNKEDYNINDFYKYICDAYDYDIVMNVYGYDDNGNETIIINNLWGIINRVIKMQPEHMFNKMYQNLSMKAIEEKHFHRKKKYMAYGYTFSS